VPEAVERREVDRVERRVVAPELRDVVALERRDVVAPERRDVVPLERRDVVARELAGVDRRLDVFPVWGLLPAFELLLVAMWCLTPFPLSRTLRLRSHEFFSNVCLYTGSERALQPARQSAESGPGGLGQLLRLSY
jgi:hypothetical protein